MPDATPETQYEKRQQVCIGWRMDTSGKMQQMWRSVNPDNILELNDAEVYWRGKTVVGAKPGAVYEFTYEGTGTFLSDATLGPKWQGMWYDAAKIAEWQALSKAVDQAEKARRAADRMQSRDYIDDALDPIFRALRRAKSPAERAAIKLMVMERMEKAR